MPVMMMTPSRTRMTLNRRRMMILMIPVTVTRMKMTTSWVLALPVGPTGPGQPGQAPKTCRCHLQLRVACSRRRIRLGAAGPGDSDIITGIRHSFHGLGRRDRRTLAHSECFLHFLDFGKGQTEEDSICNSKKLDRQQAESWLIVHFRLRDRTCQFRNLTTDSQFFC